MPVTYPLTLDDPAIRLMRVAFTPLRRVAVAALPLQAQAVELSPGVWSAEVVFRPARESEHRRYEAIANALAPAGAKIYVHSPRKCWPALHPGGTITGAWADTLSVTSVTATTITATAPNPALRLSAGDMISLEGNGRVGLYQVLVAAQPVSGAITVDVWPRLPSGLFDSGTRIMRLKKPRCLMQLDPSSPPDMGDSIRLVPVSMRLIQAGF